MTYAGADPFALLKECVMMSNFHHNEDPAALMRKQEYDNMVNATAAASATGYDPASLAAKMAKFKFAKKAPEKKDADWFKKLEDKAKEREKEETLERV